MTHLKNNVYRCIKHSYKQRGISPTIREIMCDLNLSSGSVTYNIDKLIAAGKLTRIGKYTARTLQLVEDAP